MNEASKAAIAVRIENPADEDGEVDFDFGTEVGKEAALAAIRQYLFDSPESVTPRPAIEAKRKGS